jgi:endo-1,4-beta-xylanase
MARSRFPHAKLLINDYSIINTPKDTARYRSVIELLQHDHLIDGIGVQAHAFETHGVPATTLRTDLDTLAATGLPIYITEMDIDGRNDATQLREYQRVFPLFWNDPAVKGITLWGFRPGLWRDAQGANLVRKDGSERPALEWLRGYVRAEHPAQ